jgi:pimeloyl-ACP methyl ester carboxylesterase
MALTRLFAPRRLLLAGCALLCLHAHAQSPSAAADPCAPRGTAAASAAAPAPRLPELRYRCLRLPSGQHLWVGQAGDAKQPAVLLLHGLGNNAHLDWSRSVGPLLAQGFQVLTLDLPGFGASPPPPQAHTFQSLGAQLVELLDQAVPGQRVHVVGHSLGAALSLHFAHRHASRVERLVLVDAAGILLKPVFAQNIASLPRRQIGFAPLDWVLGIAQDRVNGLSRWLFLGPDGSFDFVPWLMRNPEVRQALLGGMTQLDAALNLVEQDFSAAIRETAAPTTVIWGGDDRVAPLRTGTLLAARLPDARLHIIDGAAHTPMLEQPALFNSLLLQALAAPWRAKSVQEPAMASQGHVVCRNTDGVRYSGRFDSITLQSCGSVRIENAQMQQLTLVHSDVVIENSVIDSPTVALQAQRSEVMATAVHMRGRVAIRTDNSFFDLAGVSLVALGQVVDMAADEPTSKPSRLFFSVSDWRGSDHQGDAHFIWPRPR